MSGGVEKFLEQLAVVKAAPIPFAIATVTPVLAALAFMWYAYEWRYSGIIANKDSDLVLARSQRDDYKDKLGGATPAEAKAKIDALERTVQMVVGSKWEPLTAGEIELLSSKLRGIPPRFTNILYENQLGKDLANTLLSAFKRAGWSEVWVSHGIGHGPGFSVGYGSGTALKVKTAIEATTKFRPTLQLPNEQETEGSNFFVSVGINLN